MNQRRMPRMPPKQKKAPFSWVGLLVGLVTLYFLISTFVWDFTSLFSRFSYGGSTLRTSQTKKEIRYPLLQSKQAAKLGTVWAHGVNSKENLAAVLKDKDITAIEVDVMLDREKNLALVGHPPNAGDLSVDEFLEEISRSSFNQRREHILKLDFKDTTAMVNSIPAINKHIRQGLQVTVMLNADVQCAKSGCTLLVDPDIFFQQVALVPSGTASVGWQSDSDDCPDDESMKALTRLVTEKTKDNTPVIYAINIKCGVPLWSKLAKILTLSPHYEVLFWVSKGEKVDEDNLIWVFNIMETDNKRCGRSYYDIPGFKGILSEGQKRRVVMGHICGE